MVSLGKLDWGNWAYRLASSSISGGASAASSAVVSPIIDSAHFNPNTSAYYKLMVGMFLGSTLLKFFVFLSSDPLPEPVKTVTTTEVVEKPAPGTTVKTVVQETKIEPPKPEVTK